MKVIGDILPFSRIVLDLETSSKKRLFEQVAEMLESESGLPKEMIFDCLFAREKLGSTGLGQGVAIPHGRSSCVQNVTGLFARLKEPVGFDAPDGKAVSLVFVLLVPEQATGEHLEILSHLASKFSDKHIRDELLHADKETVHRLLLSEA
ncbi:PTS IIA-like nitrogen regulatory protein PtsN [Wielerella bovis]|uniref:PTS IIA-like nitrogen regulatory protein PtsN n=1 Tax=Wielerella bovis TaxID=2917790 RepID=UPI0020187CBC|nr:PTS IIA-like nitrogen regulatory protein PtsN [Wielerella bovis]MCG7657728.1 PTS IIA-like nitrogen regulatory protein PtsN [Wielerella bovis]MCG7659949.1 PTS IIA-like nitrogen regulatory protein PtsN [Wielerella bovis]ULJ61124.1 PTS IIA-like nitrogen regulatory protein PtsN [Wielerella bovis]ULJ62137.1 PTS IIA-like nitrogen regulatory protein PtsN [Wielerella bovis]ULJ64368.1 PTS IIA-like nitrogen regulatory protein PtsN [Wielerella bovis]